VRDSYRLQSTAKAVGARINAGRFVQEQLSRPPWDTPRSVSPHGRVLVWSDCDFSPVAGRIVHTSGTSTPGCLYRPTIANRVPELSPGD
jgi:hypothetical protein